MLKTLLLLVSHPRFWVTCLLVALSLMAFISNSVGGFPVESIDIGTGSQCFKFAIFADPQSDLTNLKAAVDEINKRVNNSGEDIRFVIVSGDIGQGEKATAAEYQAEFTQAKNILDGLLIPYILEDGNHDVWCNLSGGPIHVPDSSRNIPLYTSAIYPEEIFETVFGLVYNQLATILAGWTKQEGMPLSNPYGFLPPTYFQNLAFDYGDYHFVGLDFCARDDFDPANWEILINGQPLDFAKYQFGYARGQNEYSPNGTIDWFEDNLEKFGYCDPDRYDRGYKRSKNIILFSHHAPVFNLEGTGKYYTTPITWKLNDWNTFGFNQTEYNDLVSRLNSLYSNHGFNYQWFTGHYHVKDMEWTDNQITPPSNVPVKVIASVQPLTWITPPPGVVIDPAVTINNAYLVTTVDNLTGQITIVTVLQPGGTDPDPSIYNPERHAGHPAEWPLPVVWNNPDIEIYDVNGTTFVPSSLLNYNVTYTIKAKIYNKGGSDANINVKFTWGKEAFNYQDTQTGFTGDGGVGDNIMGPYLIHSGEEIVVPIKWNTSKVSTGAGTVTIHACVRAIIERVTPADDWNLNNNRGQENCDVHNCETAKSDSVLVLTFPITNNTGELLKPEVDVYPESGQGTLWNPVVYIYPEGIDSGKTGTVKLELWPIQGTVRNLGDNETFSLTARNLITGEITGGLDVKVVVDDPPILDWVGDSGYERDGVEPDTGDPGTKFVFRVKYRDDNNHPPAPGHSLIYLLKGNEQLQGSPFVMGEEDPNATDYIGGKIYKYSITLSEPGDDYTYYFWARDSLGIGAEGPATQITPGPVVTEPINKVEIAQIDSVNPGDIVSLPVLMENPEPVGGFYLYIEFDPTALYFKGVERGSGLPEGFEYFTYRQLPCPMCGCCKYKLQVLGLYDLKDTHQGIPIPPRDYQDTLFKIIFKVANDNNLRGFKIPIRWEWDPETCTENTKSDPSGNILYVSMDTTQFNPIDCPTQPGSQVIPSIYFIDGGIQVATIGEKEIGDINLNGIPFDPGDVTLFSSYFIYGTGVFVIDLPLQIASTDINRDGFTLTLSDFIYMLRVILHDVSQPKPAPAEEVVTITAKRQNSHLTVSSDQPLGAALLVFNYTGKVNNLSCPFATNSNIEVSENELRILIYMKDAGGISGELLSFQATGEIKLSKVEAVDNQGRTVKVVAAAKTIPEKFALYQNHPNPFNLETQISFDLPVNSKVSLKIYNIKGQLVRTLLDKEVEAGQHKVVWDGKNQKGEIVASGIYFYRLKAGDYVSVKKMGLVK